MPSRGLLEVHSVHWRHAPGLSCRHVTRSTHRASGYQLAAICYLWSSGGLDFSRAEPAAKRQEQQPVQRELLTASHSIDFAQGSSHQPPAWAGELPSTSRSGKGEHRRHIITTGQTLSVSTSTFSLHLQLECSTKSLSTS